MSSIQSRTSQRRNTFYLLPNLFTTLGLLSGFYAIVAAMDGRLEQASIAIIVAWMFDGLDGRIARLTRTTSAFGKEYDSLCDLVSFGIAPAIVAYEMVLANYGRYGWLAAFLYVATTALRLARFNCQPASQARFVGLPCPAAAVTVAAAVLFTTHVQVGRVYFEPFLLVLIYLLSYLMVSTVPYPSFKKAAGHGSRKFQTMVAMVLLVTVVAAEPHILFFSLCLIYIGSGFWLLVRHAPEAEVEEELLSGRQTE